MNPILSKILFDPQDYELLDIVGRILGKERSERVLKDLFDPNLHPHGIKEMAAPKELRVAYAVIRLLDSLEAGKMEDRLSALQSLRDEVLFSAKSALRKNTARVLLQIMKELVRTSGNSRQRLELAHDFRTAASGKPRIVRFLLRRYHLFEMPEEWNQVAFDDHVHDANTKGRKSPTHLIMDAWIKGIRHLTVVYYNYVRPEVAAELLEAARIMGITVRIGLELSTRFRNRYVHFIWEPRGFSDVRGFLNFLAEPAVAEFMEEGRKASKYQQRYVLAMLQEFNRRHRRTLNTTFGFELGPLDPDEFYSFVGPGQTSILHLAEFIHACMLPVMHQRVESLRVRYRTADPGMRKKIVDSIKQMNALDSESIVERYLRPAMNPAVFDPDIPRNDPDVPKILRYSPGVLVDLLNRLHTGFRITLNLTNLSAVDVLELLYDCKGKITHLEIFNLKDHVAEKTANISKINALQNAITDGNVITLKRIIRSMIQDLAPVKQPDESDKIEKLKKILTDISLLTSYYKNMPLSSRIGSDSTGRSRRFHGMGLVVVETLPKRAGIEIERSVDGRQLTLPVCITTYLRATYIPYADSNIFFKTLIGLARVFPGFRTIGKQRQMDWLVESYTICRESRGNVAALGGIHQGKSNGLRLEQPETDKGFSGFSLKYLNTGFKNGLKILVGFIPAFATFALTKQWWMLAYFGAIIWFFITGLRNILQSVLGGRGIRRSPVLGWKDYISWERICDSLLYTGFSVPLLDYVVKTVLLDRLFGITTTTNPAAMYSVMALANGIYISSHNVLRGLPRGAVAGNFFRSILSIPLAIVFNAAIGGVLAAAGVEGVNGVLQKWAAIISKSASDCVAGIIEGFTDRINNIRMRAWDFSGKLAQLFDIYARIEMLFPEADVLKMFDSPRSFLQMINGKARDPAKALIINSLDFLYFWMYQPRARTYFKALLKNLSPEEQQVLVKSQSVLQWDREVTQMFVDGIVGRNFSRALAFYLDRSGEYLEATRKMFPTAALPEAPHATTFTHLPSIRYDKID